MFAIQSRRQDSWAVRAHGHGLRHSEESGVSSVSSAKHIQHFRGSSAGVAGADTASKDSTELSNRTVRVSSGETELCCVCGEVESLRSAEPWAALSAACLDGLWCDAELCGNEAMVSAIRSRFARGLDLRCPTLDLMFSG